MAMGRSRAQSGSSINRDGLTRAMNSRMNTTGAGTDGGTSGGASTARAGIRFSTAALETVNTSMAPSESTDFHFMTGFFPD